MAKFYSLFLMIIFLICACKGPKKEPKTIKNNKKVASTDSAKFANSTDLSDFDKGKTKNQIKYDNGLIINWFNNGSGEKLKNGEVVAIEYRLALPDGKIIDGNNRAKLPFIPFIVGYNMQTIGWDLALNQLRVGDFVKVEIPSYLAMGKNGLPGIVPPNYPNWLYLKVIARISPEYDLDGIKTWTFNKGVETEKVPGRLNEIEYNAIVSTISTPNVINTFKSNIALKYVQGQKNIVPGLAKVFKNIKKGQKIYVLLDAKNAYGSKGFVNLVKPNEGVFYNISVRDIRAI